MDNVRWGWMLFIEQTKSNGFFLCAEGPFYPLTCVLDVDVVDKGVTVVDVDFHRAGRGVHD